MGAEEARVPGEGWLEVRWERSAGTGPQAEDGKGLWAPSWQVSLGLAFRSAPRPAGCLPPRSRGAAGASLSPHAPHARRGRPQSVCSLSGPAWGGGFFLLPLRVPALPLEVASALQALPLPPPTLSLLNRHFSISHCRFRA